MKPAFWIASITVAGHHTKPDSSVTFKQGLNVVCGPSNTGKSWVLQCVDYMFGMDAKDFALDEGSGYTEIQMKVHSDRGTLTLTRPIGQGNNNIEVTSSDARVPSGTYKRTGGKNAALLNHVWLLLAGFQNPETLKVIKNKNFELQALTLRSMWHALYADEDRISIKTPILLHPQKTSQTAGQSALAAFITDKDYAAYAQAESVETKQLRNNAIIEYLEPIPAQLQSRIDQLVADLGGSDPAHLEHQISTLKEEVEKVKSHIRAAAQQGQQVVKKLQHTREQLAESTSLASRYEELASSYRAKISRFDFVHEGHVLMGSAPESRECPVCSQHVPESGSNLVPAPDPKERQTLKAHLQGLLQTLAQMEVDRRPLVDTEKHLTSESARITADIRDKLEPQLQELTALLAQNNAIVATRTELEQSRMRKEDVEAELLERKTRTFPKGNFNALDEFPDEFWEQMDTGLLDTLGACAFPGLKTVSFSREIFDAVVNGKIKARQGKGYRSFVNTSVMLTLRDFLASEDSAHNLGLLLIDTPLLGLDDPQLDPELLEVRETIPLALYEYLVNKQEAGQVIIADNTKFMPEIEQFEASANFIIFTKRADEGRYGFLLSTQDEDLIDQELSDGN